MGEENLSKKYDEVPYVFHIHCLSLFCKTSPFSYAEQNNTCNCLELVIASSCHQKCINKYNTYQNEHELYQIKEYKNLHSDDNMKIAL